MNPAARLHLKLSSGHDSRRLEVMEQLHVGLYDQPLFLRTKITTRDPKPPHAAYRRFLRVGTKIIMKRRVRGSLHPPSTQHYFDFNQ